MEPVRRTRTQAPCTHLPLLLGQLLRRQRAVRCLALALKRQLAGSHVVLSVILRRSLDLVVPAPHSSKGGPYQISAQASNGKGRSRLAQLAQSCRSLKNRPVAAAPSNPPQAPRALDMEAKPARLPPTPALVCCTHLSCPLGLTKAASACDLSSVR